MAPKSVVYPCWSPSPQMRRGPDWIVPTFPVDTPQFQFYPHYLPPGSQSGQRYPYYTMRPRPVPLRVQEPRFGPNGGSYGDVFEPSDAGSGLLAAAKARPALTIAVGIAAFLVGWVYVRPLVWPAAPRFAY